MLRVFTKAVYSRTTHNGAIGYAVLNDTGRILFRKFERVPEDGGNITRLEVLAVLFALENMEEDVQIRLISTIAYVPFIFQNRLHRSVAWSTEVSRIWEIIDEKGLSISAELSPTNEWFCHSMLVDLKRVRRGLAPRVLPGTCQDLK